MRRRRPSRPLFLPVMPLVGRRDCLRQTRAAAAWQVSRFLSESQLKAR